MVKRRIAQSIDLGPFLFIDYVSVFITSMSGQGIM